MWPASSCGTVLISSRRIQRRTVSPVPIEERIQMSYPRTDLSNSQTIPRVPPFNSNSSINSIFLGSVFVSIFLPIDLVPTHHNPAPQRWDTSRKVIPFPEAQDV